MEIAKSVRPLETVEKSILLVRGQKVILDADLAKLYGVTTKRLNQQVSRNRGGDRVRVRGNSFPS